MSCLSLFHELVSLFHDMFIVGSWRVYRGFMSRGAGLRAWAPAYARGHPPTRACTGKKQFCGKKINIFGKKNLICSSTRVFS